MSWGTDDVLGSHIRTYKFKRLEERSFFIAGGGGSKWGRREISFASLKSADSY